MKKVLLIASVALAAVSASAQQKVVPAKNYNAPVAVAKYTQAIERVQRPAMEYRTKALVSTSAEKTFAPRKTKATGLYYTKPAGTMFAGWSLEGTGFGPQVVVMPSMQNLTFVNHSTDAASTKWMMNGQDLTQYADEALNMPWACEPGSMYYPLTLTNAAGTDSYTLGEFSNYYYVEKLTQNPSLLTTFPSETQEGYDFAPMYMGYYNDHTNEQYAFGGMDKRPNSSYGYLFGTGTVTFSDTQNTLPMVGVLQEYEKPASPLYVEDFYCQIISVEPNGTPIAEGKEITAYILNAETGENIATLVATKDDIFGAETNAGRTYGMLRFTQYTEGIFGGDPVATPFVIDCPFVVQITGFAQEGVDFGFMGGKNGSNKDEESEEELSDTFGVVYDAAAENEEDRYSYLPLYSRDGINGVSINIQFNALFDVIDVMQFGQLQTGEVVRANDVCVNNEGDACYNRADENMPGAIVYTAFPWFDSEDNSYYSMELPEWVVTAEVDGSQWEDQSGFNLVGFQAEPLPTGVEGRGALVTIEGRGVTAPCPIFVYQGSYEAALKDIPEGIRETITNKTNTSNTIYDLAGRRVVRNTRGVVVANGQKILK